MPARSNRRLPATVSPAALPLATLFLVALALLGLPLPTLRAMPLADSPSAASQPAPPPAAQPAQPPAARSKEQLIAEFQQRLTNVELSGHFRGTNDLAKRVPLGPPVEEKYTIVSAVPDVDDFWIFNARIQYGDHDVTVPLRLKVAWADDTPVVVVDNVNIPGIGVYSARVLFYRDYYSGTWFGPNCGGVLAGEIRRLPSP